MKTSLRKKLNKCTIYTYKFIVSIGKFLYLLKCPHIIANEKEFV